MGEDCQHVRALGVDDCGIVLSIRQAARFVRDQNAAGNALDNTARVFLRQQISACSLAQLRRRDCPRRQPLQHGRSITGARIVLATLCLGLGIHHQTSEHGLGQPQCGTRFVDRIHAKPADNKVRCHVIALGDHSVQQLVNTVRHTRAARLNVAAAAHDILLRYRYLLVEGQLSRRHGLERTSENGKLDDACRHTSRVRRHSDFTIERRERLRVKRHSIDRGRPTIWLDKGFDILLKAGNPRSPGDSFRLLSGRMIRLLFGRDSRALSLVAARSTTAETHHRGKRSGQHPGTKHPTRAIAHSEGRIPRREPERLHVVAATPTLLAAVHRLTPHHRILPSRR